MYSKRIHATAYLTTGDSIVGTLKPKGEYLRFIKVKTSSGKKVKIPLQKITLLKLNILRYSPLDIHGRLHLLEEVAHGELQLYAYLKKSDNRSRKYFYLRREGEKGLLIDADNFQAVANKYLFKDDYIKGKIESGEWDYNDIVKAFRVYNYRSSK
tara:strand:+ start:26698 stop:27162 length:465 start_codon:yes stop_codon:yes gene_type:complete